MQKSRLSRWCYNQYVTNHEQPIVVEEEKSKNKNKTIKLFVLTSLEKLIGYFSRKANWAILRWIRLPGQPYR